MNDQSQAQYGPFFLSFGDLHMQVLHAKKAYNLTDREYQLLQCFIQAMPRPGYKSHLTAFVKQDVSFWISHTGLQKTHIYKAFRSLAEKKVIISVTGLAKIQRHALHPNFAQAVYDESLSVEKSMLSDRIGHSSVTELVTGSDRIGHSSVTELVTGSDRIGHTRTYIDIPSPIPRDSPSIPRSNPAVDNVDNFTAQERRLSNWYDENQLEKARAFITKLKGSQLGRLDEFLDFLDNDWRDELGTKGMNLIWAKWSLGEMTKANPLRIVSNAPQGELGAL